MIAISCALPTESSNLRRLLKGPPGGVRPNDSPILRSQLNGEQIVLLHTGVGTKICRERLNFFFATESARCLISIGFAGALSDRLKVGDLFVAENFSSSDLVTIAGSVLSKFQPVFGRLITASEMVDEAIDRQRLRVESGAEAVDMETECIAQVCKERGLPILSLRAITDTPATPFPAPPGVLFNVERQRTDPKVLAAHVLKNPIAAFQLIRFARQIATVRERLTNAIVTLLKSGTL